MPTDSKENLLTQATKLLPTDFIRIVKDLAGTPLSQVISRDIFINGGWLEVSDSWTYASATTINVPTNATLFYQKGWGVRFKQGGGYKYFYLTTVAATLLTVTGGSDYSVANSAITDIAVCPNPNGAFGFPAYFNHTVVINGDSGSAGTYAESVALEGKFSISGARVSFQCSKKVTNKGSWGGNVQILLPVTPSSIYSGVFQGPPCWWANAAAIPAKAVLRLANSETLLFLDAINSSFFTWAELTANDWLILNVEYWF